MAWNRYKLAWNHTDNEIKNAKRKYLTDNLESSKSSPKKIWQLINDLPSRHPNKVRNNAEIKVPLRQKINCDFSLDIKTMLIKH